MTIWSGQASSVYPCPMDHSDQYSLCSKIRSQKFFCGRTHYENYREKARKKRATQTRPHGAQIGQNQQRRCHHPPNGQRLGPALECWNLRQSTRRAVHRERLRIPYERFPSERGPFGSLSHRRRELGQLESGESSRAVRRSGQPECAPQQP